MKKIIEMAREAGWKDLRDYDSEMHDDIFMGKIDSLKAFAELVRADEREACAKVAERFEPDEKTSYVTYASTAIRARGNT